jgi:hypothetical protein
MGRFQNTHPGSGMKTGNKLTFYFIWFFLVNPLFSAVPFFVRDSSKVYHRMQWTDPAVAVFINPSSSNSMTNDDVNTEIQAAADTWNSIPDCNVNIGLTSTTVTPPASDIPDGLNHISFVNSGLNPLVIGITYTSALVSTGEIIDADVQFNQTSFQFVPWDENDPNKQTDISVNRIALRAVATHEMGHLLGLDHSPLKKRTIDLFELPESTMYPYLSDDQITLAQDDISLISFMYPSAANRYRYSVRGKINSGQSPGSTLNGVHVILWDNITNPNVVISSISGFSPRTGISFNGEFEVIGLPAGNYVAFIEPFPITDDYGNTFDLENNSDIFNRNYISTQEKEQFLRESHSFPLEFWHGASESRYEISSGFENAELFAINETMTRTVNFETNYATALPELSGSTFLSDQSMLYANGTTSTKLVFTPKDRYGNVIEADISSRLKFTLTTGSFSASSSIIETRPIHNPYDNSYYLNVFSVRLQGDTGPLQANANVLLDDVQVFTRPYAIYFEKASKNSSEIEFIADIANYTGVAQNLREVFADGISPATWRIRPKFSNGSDIPVPITTDPTLTYFSSLGIEGWMTTYPITSIGNNLYQTTLTSNLQSVLTEAEFFLDEVPLKFTESVRFSFPSTVGSRFYIDGSTIHVRHPLLTTTPTATVYVEPCFENGSAIPTDIPTAQIDVLVSRIDGSPASARTLSVEGPLLSDAGEKYYTCKIEAGFDIEQLKVKISILGSELAQTRYLNVEVSDPDQTSVATRKKYLLVNSAQKAIIEIIPKFRDGTLVGLDLSEFLNMSSNISSLENDAGQQTTVAVPSLNPDYRGGGIHEIFLNAGTEKGAITVSGRVFAQSFLPITETATVYVVDPSPNFLSVTLNDEIISADGQSVTTITVIPLFADSTPIGSDFNETRLTASLTEGIFLRKTLNPNTGLINLEPIGKDFVSFYGLGDGSFELSVRSSNYSTISLIQFHVDGVLSTITEEIIFSVIGSADPLRTTISVNPAFIYADGNSFSEVLIIPRASNGERIILPTESAVVVQSTLGTLSGAIVKNSTDGSYRQKIRSVKSHVPLTAFISVDIDSIHMTPSTSPAIHFVNLNTRSLVSHSFPVTERIDGFDAALLARAIRNRVCSSVKIEDQNTCNLFDFNSDGLLDLNDMNLFLSAFGRKVP